MSVVARLDFHDDLGVLVERGDVFAENAEVVRHYPHRFEPHGGGERKSYTGLITRAGGTAKLIDRAGGESSSPALERSTSTGVVPVLDAGAKPKLTVRLNRTALDVIRDEIAALGPFLLERGYETGGNLVGRERGGVVEVIDASGPEASPDDRSERRFVDAVRISATSGVEIAQELRAQFRRPDDHAARRLARPPDPRAAAFGRRPGQRRNGAGAAAAPIRVGRTRAVGRPDRCPRRARAL